MTQSRAGLFLVAPLLFGDACRSPSRESAAFARAVTSAESRLEDAAARCEAAIARSDWPAARTAADEAAAGAAEARDFIEKLRVAPVLDTARREELLFTNHAFLAYQDFAARGASGVDAEKLESILRRGRIHQARGRESLD